MILTCPNCATRYQADAAKFPAAGRQVRCAKCGTVWHQPGPALSDLEHEGPVLAPSSIAAAPVVSPSEPESLSRTRATISFPRPEAQKPPIAWLPIVKILAGWTALIAVVLALGYAALHYRQDVAAVWPQSADVYSTLGMNVNVNGIDFRHVEYHRESEDGQVVLAVTGTIFNSGNRELSVPQMVRVTLSDAGNHELYHWNFTPTAATLKPGQSIAFLTRLSSPPAAARHLEVRFAKEGQ